MSKVLFYKEENDEKAKIMMIHNQPDLLKEERRKQGYEIDEMPSKPETDKGEKALPYLNPKTGEVWYKIVDKKLDKKEKRIKDLEDKIKKIEKRIRKLE